MRCIFYYEEVLWLFRHFEMAWERKMWRLQTWLSLSCYNYQRNEHGNLGLVSFDFKLNFTLETFFRRFLFLKLPLDVIINLQERIRVCAESGYMVVHRWVAFHKNWLCSRISQLIFNLFFWMKDNLKGYLVLKFYKNRWNIKSLGVMQS